MLVDANITKAWWQECLKDAEKQNRWLQKLQVTELDGYIGNFEANAEWNKEGDRVLENFLIQTARDELRHSRLLVDLLRDRGIKPKVDQTPTSLYWYIMECSVASAKEMCATFYLGERLASERFEIIAECKETPEDIKKFIDSALPDEQMHMKGYEKLAGEEAIAAMTEIHNHAMKKVLGNRVLKSELT